MKAFSSLSLTFLLSLLVVSGATSASVLLPDSDTTTAAPSPDLDGNMDTVNLGLLPATQPQSTSTTPTNGSAANTTKKFVPTTATDSSTSNNFAPGGSVDPAAKEPTGAQKILAGQIANGRVPQSETLTLRQQQIRDVMANINKSLSLDPTIIDEPNYELPDDPSLTSSIAVMPLQNYTWGKTDASYVERSLGYSADAVPQNCQMKFRATLQSAGDQFSMRSTLIFPGEQKSLKFSPSTKLTAVSFQPFAVCLKPNGDVPKRGGIIMKSSDGKLYIIQMTQTATCTVQAGMTAPTSLTMRYKGDGKADCAFN